MPNNNLTTREKARQERERAKSRADRSRQLIVKKAAQLQEQSRRAEAAQAAARITQVTEKN